MSEEQSNKVFADWSQSILNLTVEKMCRNCATPLVMALVVQLLLIVCNSVYHLF